LKTAAALTAFVFTVTQVAWAGEYQIAASGVYQPVTEIGQTGSAQDASPVIPSLTETQRFLSETLSLVPSSTVNAAETPMDLSAPWVRGSDWKAEAHNGELEFVENADGRLEEAALDGDGAVDAAPA
jgi:hypothetical protein